VVVGSSSRHRCRLSLSDDDSSLLRASRSVTSSLGLYFQTANPVPARSDEEAILPSPGTGERRRKSVRERARERALGRRTTIDPGGRPDCPSAVAEIES